MIASRKKMRYCPKYKLKVDEEFNCTHCEFNFPITLNWKTNCRYPKQLEWTKNFDNIDKE